MKISRWIYALAVGATFGTAALTAPAATAAPVTGHTSVAAPMTDPSDGYCEPWEDGAVKLGADGRFYKCSHVDGLGWWWVAD